MAPHIGGDRPKNGIVGARISHSIVPVQQPVNYNARSVVRFGMAGGPKVGDRSMNPGFLQPRAGFVNSPVYDKNVDDIIHVSEEVSTVQETRWISESATKSTNDTFKNIHWNGKSTKREEVFTSQYNVDTVRKKSVRTVVVNGVKNMDDMGEIAQILNDSSCDGLISSECEKRLREKYGLHFEHTFLSDDSKLADLPMYKPSDLSLLNDDGTFINETGTIYGQSMTCGGGALVRQKFGEMMRRYSELVQATSFVRQVVQRAKKPIKKRRSLQATKIGPSPGVVTPIKSGLTIIPENVETVGEALLRLCPPSTTPTSSTISPDCTRGTEFTAFRKELGLDLGNGEFEKRLSVIGDNERNSVVFRDKPLTNLVKSSEKPSGPLKIAHCNERPAIVCARNNKTAVSPGVIVNRENGNCSSKCSNSNRSSLFGGDRSSSCTEEGASTSWLLVLYSPEFAPKNLKQNRSVTTSRNISEV